MLYPEQIRDRVQNMAIFFVDRTTNVNSLKLDKLFYFTDDLAIRRIVFSISKQPYFADTNGPVPVDIDKNCNIIPTYSLLEVIREKQDGTFEVMPGKRFIDDEFNDRELEVLEEICVKYQNTTGEELSALSHTPNEPWDIVWNKENGGHGSGKPIALEALIDETFPPEEQERRRLLRESVAKANAAFLKLPGVKARMEAAR